MKNLWHTEQRLILSFSRNRMNNNKKLDTGVLQSKTIDWLRFPLTVAVVYIHMLPKIHMTDFRWDAVTDKGLYSLLGLWGSNILASVAVPTFFFFSGYLFFYGKEPWSQKIYKEKVIKRVRTLLVPYFLWNIIAVLCFLTLLFLKSKIQFYDSLEIFGWPHIFRLFWNFHEWTGATNLLISSQLILSAPFDIPLWFVRDLLVGVLLSPLIYWLLDKLKFLFLICLGIMYFLNFDSMIPGVSFMMLFFFSLGGYFGKVRKNFLFYFSRIKYFAYIVAIASFCGLTLYHDTVQFDIIFPFFVVSGMISLIAMVSYFLEKGYIWNVDFLSEASFFVFSIHLILILKYSDKFCEVLGLRKFVGMTGVYLITPIICIIICLGIFYILRKYLPGIMVLLTGDRAKK